MQHCSHWLQRVCRFWLKSGKKRYPGSHKTVTTTFEATLPHEARIYQWPRYILLSCQWFTGESKRPSDKMIAEFAIPKVMFQKGHLPSCLSVPVLVWGTQNCFSYMKTVCWHHGSQSFFLNSLSPLPLHLALPSIFPESLLWASALSRNHHIEI